MLNNDPRIRQVIYWVSVAVGLAAIALKAVPTVWATQTKDALEEVATYLLTLSGVTAVTNLTSGPNTRLLDQPKQ